MTVYNSDLQWAVSGLYECKNLAEISNHSCSTTEPLSIYFINNNLYSLPVLALQKCLALLLQSVFSLIINRTRLLTIGDVEQNLSWLCLLNLSRHPGRTNKRLPIEAVRWLPGVVCQSADRSYSDTGTIHFSLEIINHCHQYKLYTVGTGHYDHPNDRCQVVFIARWSDYIWLNAISAIIG